MTQKSTADNSQEIAQKNELKLKQKTITDRPLIVECFTKYMNYSSMVNKENQVTAEALKQFKDIFVNNALVWNDVVSSPTMIDVEDYADDVFYHLPEVGLKVEFEDDVINRFYSNYPVDMLNPKVDSSDLENGSMIYEFVAEKKMYHILSEDKKLEVLEDPLAFDLIFVFHVSSKINRSKLMEIKPLNN